MKLTNGGHSPVSNNSKGLVDPQLNHGLGVVVVLLGGLHHSLNYLGKIPGVEQVVALAGRGEKLPANRRVDLDAGLGQGISHGLDLIVKVHQLVCQERAVDPLQLRLTWRRHVHYVEASQDALAEGIAPSSRWCHRGHELHVLHVLQLALLPIVPEPVVNPKLQQLKGRDEPELALLGHVQIVNEGDKVLASRGREDSLGPLFQPSLDRVLQGVA
mmetsp:Transcript_6177/g.22107  ORF Transcript_6177/g.22107 Transcript_6177/m.22107 type:complete len:215 (+) Transcript_6177:256-900(+)